VIGRGNLGFEFGLAEGQKELFEVFAKNKSMSRFVDVGSHTFVGFDHVSLMIMNMPDLQSGKHGQVKDTLAILLESVEARVVGIMHEQSAQCAEDSKRLFLAAMSHELRTPLNAIVGFTQILSRKKEGSEFIKSDLDSLSILDRNSAHLLGLIEDLLDFASLDAGDIVMEHENVPIQELLGNILDNFRLTAETKGLSLSVEFGPGLDLIHIDPKRFRQIVKCLVSNGIKYTKAGVIGLLFKKDIHEELGEVLSFSIEDTGIGIKLEDVELLFQKFRQIDRRLAREYDGAGLGLAMANEFARLMGGYIRVDSEHGIGSTFEVIIPLEPQADGYNAFSPINSQIN